MNKIASYKIALSKNNLWNNEQEKEASILNLMAGAALSGQPVDTSMLDAANNVPEITFNYDANTLKPTSVQGPSNLVSPSSSLHSPVTVDLSGSNPSGLGLQNQSSVFTNPSPVSSQAPLGGLGDYTLGGGSGSYTPSSASIPTNVDPGIVTGKIPSNSGAAIPPPPAATVNAPSSPGGNQLPSTGSSPSNTGTSPSGSPQGLFTNKNIATGVGAIGGGVLGNVAGGAIGSRFGKTDKAQRRNANIGRGLGTIAGGVAGAKGLRALVN